MNDTTPRRGRPRLSRRTAERVQISLLPEDREALDQIATELGEPGMPPNRSAAFRRVLREWREARSGESGPGTIGT